MAGIDDGQFRIYIDQMKKCLAENDLEGGLSYAKKAYKIHQSDKLKRRITKLEDYLLEVDEFSEGEDVAKIADGFFIAKHLDNQLYEYQREGVAWMYSLFTRKKGGILADDMGLGKTLQTITFLTGLIDAGEIGNALIVMPATLMSNWMNEFQKWSPSINIYEYQGDPNSRQRPLANVQRNNGVLLTTYGLVTNSAELLSTFRGREFVWDFVILDEGHKIKNPTKCKAAVNRIPAKNRLLLTGTPIQNNLSELWSLFDFVHHGTLLGTQKTFKMEFETPITRSREKNATVNEKRYGEEMAKILMKKVQPFLLRRTKAETLEKVNSNANGQIKAPQKLTQKNDLVIWLRLSNDQIRIYEDFLHSERVKEILMTKRSPLVELTILKKICDHPRLLSAAVCSELGLNGDDGGTINLKDLSNATLMRESEKLNFFLNLMKNLKSEGHRVLVFSQSRKMLDIIEIVLKRSDFRLLRLDGTVIKPGERESIVQRFETNHSYTALLLTVQVGGVGLNLTSANRVIIFDPSWNPASDSQAVDRAYRIGQKKSVVVYRLITCASVEEKIYRRQIFKGSIYKETTEGCSNTYRYFTGLELRDMFTLVNPDVSTTQMQLEEIHAGQRNTSTELDAHIALLYSFGIFGISDNDLLFSVQDAVEDAEDPLTRNFINDKVDRANKLMDMECQLTEMARTTQGFHKTPQLPVEVPKSRKPEPKLPALQTPKLVDFRRSNDTEAIISVSETLSKLSVKNEMKVKPLEIIDISDDGRGDNLMEKSRVTPDLPITNQSLNETPDELERPVSPILILSGHGYSDMASGGIEAPITITDGMISNEVIEKEAPKMESSILLDNTADISNSPIRPVFKRRVLESDDEDEVSLDANKSKADENSTIPSLQVIDASLSEPTDDASHTISDDPISSSAEESSRDTSFIENSDAESNEQNKTDNVTTSDMSGMEFERTTSSFAMNESHLSSMNEEEVVETPDISLMHGVSDSDSSFISAKHSSFNSDMLNLSTKSDPEMVEASYKRRRSLLHRAIEDSDSE